jgi:hypothetical protein
MIPKILSVIILLAGICLSAEVGNEITPVQVAANNGNMAVLAQKVRTGKTINVGFIGGSITQGSNASKYEKCYYRKSILKISRELKDRNVKANFFCAAVPGSNSIYGSYRIGPQLLDKGIDLLVVEFAVNDIDAGNSAVDGMEGIVRQALKHKPDTAIIFFYTCPKNQVIDNYAKGKAMTSVVQHHKVAEHYHIPEVHTGPRIAALYEKDNTVLEQFFSDNAHPADAGHDYYSQWLCEAIISAFALNGSAEAMPFPSALSKNNYETAGMCGITPTSKQGDWEYLKPEIWRPFGTWKTENTDAEMAFEVKNAVGLAFSLKNEFMYKLPGMTEFKKGKVTGFPATVPRFLNFEKTSGTITIKNVTDKPGIHLTGVITRD